MRDKTMSEKTGGEKLLYCSFCGKSQHEVKKLIAGPSVYICNECIELCNEIVVQDTGENLAASDGKPAAAQATLKKSLPTPREIHAILNEYVIGQERAKRV